MFHCTSCTGVYLYSTGFRHGSFYSEYVNPAMKLNRMVGYWK